MDRLRRRSLMVVIDALLVNVAIFLAFLIRYEQLPSTFWTTYLSYAVPMTVIRILSLRFFGLYNRVWQYASIGELVSTIKAVSAGTILNSFYLFFVVQQSFSRGVVVLDWMLNILLIGGSRLGWRMLRDGLYGINRKRHGRRVLIVGAGDGGVLVAREFRNHYRGQVSIVGFIDDDPEKQQQQILGCSVLGDRTAIPHIVDTYRVEEIVIAMPSVERKTIREIVAICQETKADVKILPGVFDLFEGNVTVNQIRHVEVEDLLGREPVKVDLASMSQYISDHVVLVTGAGGSIGSELCRQIVRFSPRLLLLMDICENNMYDIEMELKGKTDVRLVPLVKDVRDRQAVNDIFRKYRPQVIFHAAAHKHVPLMEVNPEEAIKNNAMGTYHVAQAANLYGASKFVLVSTDKAVNPTSVMGASKRIAEMIIQYLNTRSDTNYVAVRFGNVLGSRGSVVPLFKKQIAAGGPVTVTDERMIRYFMTIPEAVQLIIQAGALASGGEIFVLDMGEPVPIMELAETLIKLSGFEPYTDIDIKITGMRLGEKLFEELLTAEEGVNATTHKRIFVAKPTELDTPLIERTLRNFIDGILPNGVQETERFIQAFLPGFVIVRPQDDVQAEPSFVETAASREIVENSIETQKQ